jgi:hypothetical protein
LQLAQFCTNFDYFEKAMGHFRKILTRRAIYGTGKQSAGSFTYYFKLEAEKDPNNKE